jgi:hypothetical protein
MRGSVSLLDQSTRTRQNGDRDVPGWGREAVVFFGLFFGLLCIKVSEKSCECMWGLAYLVFRNWMGLLDPCWKLVFCSLSTIIDGVEGDGGG